MFSSCMRLTILIVTLYQCFVLKHITAGVELNPTIDESGTTHELLNLTSLDEDANSNVTSNVRFDRIVSDIATFMSYHEEFCGYVSLCTLEMQYNFSSTSRFMSPCCYPCSCELVCVDDSTCCPDFWLKSATNVSVPFETLPALHKYLTKLEQSEVERIESVLDTGGALDEVNKIRLKKERVSMAETCERAQLRESAANNRPEPSAFMIVKSCPAKTPRKLSEKCQDRTKVSDISDLLPLTVIADKVSFKNRYCLECNGYSPEEAVLWDAYIVCSNHPRIIFLSEIHFDKFNDEYLRYCAVQFRPTKTITSYVQTCDKYDLESCNDGIEPSLLGYMCQTSTSRVDIKNGFDIVVAKNLACFLCNTNDTEAAIDECWRSRSAIGTSEVMLNLKAYLSSSKTNDGRQVLNEKFHPNCEVGYAYDSYKEICRKVYCPRLQILVDGECRMMYTYNKDITFSTTLMATLRGSNKQWSARRTPYLHDLHKAVMTRAKRLLSIDCNVTFWQDNWSDANANGNALLIYITFRTNTMTLEVILKRTFLLLNILSQIDAIHDVSFSAKFDVSRSLKGVIINLENKHFLKKQFPLMILHDPYDFLITDSAYCPNVEIQRDELVVLGKEVFALTYANVTLYHADGALFTEGPKLLTCYKHVHIPRPSVITVTVESVNRLPVSKKLAVTLCVVAIFVVYLGMQVGFSIRRKMRNSNNG